MHSNFQLTEFAAQRYIDESEPAATEEAVAGWHVVLDRAIE